MKRIQREITRISAGFNTLAGAAIIIMMLLTCADVLLRLLRHPIPGTYEMVGFMGTVIISLPLPTPPSRRGTLPWRSSWGSYPGACSSESRPSPP
jgi:hypothetical protein